MLGQNKSANDISQRAGDALKGRMHVYLVVLIMSITPILWEQEDIMMYSSNRYPLLSETEGYQRVPFGYPGFPWLAQGYTFWDLLERNTSSKAS